MLYEMETETPTRIAPSQLILCPGPVSNILSLHVLWIASLMFQTQGH